MLKHRVRVEFDSVEERTHTIYDGHPFHDPHFVVKLRIYNRGLFRLNGEIISMSGEPLKRSEQGGCLRLREWSDPVAIDLPGRLHRLRKTFRNSETAETTEPDFFIYEIRTLVPARLLTLNIYRSFRFFNEDSFVDVPKYFRRFRLTESERMRESVKQFAKPGVSDQMAQMFASLEGNLNYTVEEIRENFEKIS